MRWLTIVTYFRALHGQSCWLFSVGIFSSGNVRYNMCKRTCSWSSYKHSNSSQLVYRKRWITNYTLYGSATVFLFGLKTIFVWWCCEYMRLNQSHDVGAYGCRIVWEGNICVTIIHESSCCTIEIMQSTGFLGLNPCEGVWRGSRRIVMKYAIVFALDAPRRRESDCVTNIWEGTHVSFNMSAPMSDASWHLESYAAALLFIVCFLHW